MENVKKKYFQYLKNLGFIGIEAVIISGVMIFAGIVVLNLIFGNSYNDMLTNNIKPSIDTLVE